MAAQPAKSPLDTAAGAAWSPGQASRLLSALDELAEGMPPQDAAPPGYELLKMLGQGGSARVFLARRAGSERPVALKIIGRLGLHERPSAGGAYGRAWRELEILEALRLPCVPRILDYGTHAGQFYLAEEYVQGERLHEWAHAAPTLRAKVAMLAKTARCVQQIHERGVIHRDLKPSNILVSTEGEPVIVDFGLALGSAHHTLTESGTPVGTPAFMAPEQAAGQRESISTRTDVYGLGATAYFVLTGKPPHEDTGGLHDLIRRVASEPVVDPRRSRSDLPAALAAVLLKACDREPGRRYGSAGELASDLDRWLDGRPVEAQPPTGFQRLLRWAARHPRWATAGACGAIALTSLGTAGGLIWWGWTRPATTQTLGNEQGVAIVSSLHRILARWDTGFIHGIGGYARVQRANGRHAVVIAFDKPDLVTGSRGLCAYDFESGGTLLWTSDDAARAPVMPPKNGTTGANFFFARRVIVTDVFDAPGPELVVIHSNLGYSGSCIRVYDLEGTILSECWHDGVLWDMTWVSDPPNAKTQASKGIVVVSGVNSERTYQEMNLTVAGSGTHPPVLFGLRPVPGSHGWIATPTLPDPDGTDDAHPVWYRYLSPASLSSKAFAGGVILDQLTAGSSNEVRLTFIADEQHSGSRAFAGLFWMFGRNGPTGNTALPTDFDKLPLQERPYWSERPE